MRRWWLIVLVSLTLLGCATLDSLWSDDCGEVYWNDVSMRCHAAATGVFVPTECCR